VLPDAPKQGWLLEEFAAACGLSAAAALADASLAEPERRRLADQYGARSVAFLTQAADAGLYRTTPQVEKLKKDRRLTALQDREDFKKLLKDLAARATEQIKSPQE
jgi:hypothetical protein